MSHWHSCSDSLELIPIFTHSAASSGSILFIVTSICWNFSQNFKYFCIGLSSFSTSQYALHILIFMLLWTRRLRHGEETGWGRWEEKAAFLGLCCYADSRYLRYDLHGVQTWGPRFFALSTVHDNTVMCHAFLKELTTQIKEKNKIKIQKQGNRNQNWNNLPKVKKQLSGRAPDEAKDLSPKPGALIWCLFLSTRSWFTIRFYYWKWICGSHSLVSILVILQEASWQPFCRSELELWISWNYWKCC